MKYKKVKLTKKEWAENQFLTIGRLKTAIEQDDKKRALNLLEKVISDMSEMDIELMRMENR